MWLSFKAIVNVSVSNSASEDFLFLRKCGWRSSWVRSCHHHLRRSSKLEGWGNSILRTFPGSEVVFHGKGKNVQMNFYIFNNFIYLFIYFFGLTCSRSCGMFWCVPWPSNISDNFGYTSSGISRSSQLYISASYYFFPFTKNRSVQHYPFSYLETHKFIIVNIQLVMRSY